jgi:8-oxo-dGTP pyrophosphatase MutT (NUDIX family)
LLVQTSNGSWNFPGGNIDETDETSFDGIKREFKEEVGSELPHLNGHHLGSSTREPRKFHFFYRGRRQVYTTGFYCGHTTTTTFQDLSIQFRPSDEILAIKAVPITELVQMVRGTHPHMILRHCAIKSTREVLSAMGLFW